MPIELEELEKHEEITSISFDHENAHLALTHQLQGGAASGWNKALLLKSDEVDEELIKALEQVTVKLSFEEFLRKFFHMYYDEAETLTALMGFETESEYNERVNSDKEKEESYSEWRDRMLEEKLSKITVMEKAQEDISDLSTEEKISLLKSQETFEKALEEFNKGLGDAATQTQQNLSVHGSEVEDTDINKAGESEEVSSAIGSDNSKNTEINKTEGENISMSDKKVEGAKPEGKAQEVEKSETELQLEKAMTRLADLEKAAKEKEQALEKTTKQLEALEKAEMQRVEKGYKNFADSLSFVEAEEKEELVKSLMDAREFEGTLNIVKYLEKAQAAINAFGEEQGVEGEADQELSKSYDLDKAIAERYADRKYL